MSKYERARERDRQLKENHQVEQVAWRIDPWRMAVGPVTRSTVYNWIAEGRLETAKIGGTRLILTPPLDFARSHRESREL